MALFENEDFEKVLGNLNSGVPDGVIDGTDYIRIFTGLIDFISYLDPNSEQSRILFMMNVMNLVDKDDPASAYEVISACCYHIVTLLGASLLINPETKDNYVQMLYTDVVPSLSEDAKSMPYWE